MLFTCNVGNAIPDEGRQNTLFASFAAGRGPLGNYVEKHGKRRKRQRSVPLCQRKTGGGLGKGLANLQRGNRITSRKKPALVVDKKPNKKQQLIHEKT